MPQFAKQVGDAFCDHSGGVSTMRIMTVLVCMLVLGAWVTGMIVAGHYIPLGWAEAGLIGGACGAKAAQSRFELGSGGVWGAYPPTGVAGIETSAPAPGTSLRDLDSIDAGGD